MLRKLEPALPGPSEYVPSEYACQVKSCTAFTELGLAPQTPVQKGPFSPQLVLLRPVESKQGDG